MTSLGDPMVLLPLGMRSGRRCTIVKPHVPLLSDYYVLSAAYTTDALTMEELDELGTIAHRTGRQLAIKRHGDPECYSIIYNAGRTRRTPWPHFHILLASSTLEKRRAFLLLQLKHVLRWGERARLRAMGWST